MRETVKVRLKSQGRMTIPCNVRRLLDLEAGDWIKVTVEKEKGKDEA